MLDGIKNKLSMFVLSLLVLISLQSCSDQLVFGLDGGNPSNIILFSWDGFQRNHCLELLRTGSLPNLQAFIDEGVFLNLTVIDHLTQTKPGHAQMLTGYRGRHTGIYSNEFFFHPVPDGYTLLERVEEYFGEENVVTCMITGKKKNLEVDPIAELEEGEYCEKGIFSYVLEDIDVALVSEATSDIVGPRMIQFIEDYGNQHFVAFFHFAEPDKQGHQYRENSQQYDEGAISCDSWLGKILDKLDEMNIADRTLIYLITDHGFNEERQHHRMDPKIWMATNDLKLKVNENETRCDMIDVAPTIYHSLGIDAAYFAPSLDGYPLQYILPDEADSRAYLFNDRTPPVIKFDLSAIETRTPEQSAGKTDKLVQRSSALENGITLYERESFEFKFNISDENAVIGYLLLNNSLLEVYKHDKEFEHSQDGLIKLDGKYHLDRLNLEPNSYVLSVVAFDERENLSESTISISILRERTFFEKVSYHFIKYSRIFVLISGLILIITLTIVFRALKLRAREP